VPTCLSEVPFGLFLAYSPRGTSEVSQRSRTWTYAIKGDREGAIDKVLDRLSKELGAGNTSRILDSILSPAAALVDRAARLIDRHGLRAADALHVAAALTLASEIGRKSLRFLSADQEQMDAALFKGLRLLHLSR
jgi:predicted nucleic acid-binding protein